MVVCDTVINILAIYFEKHSYHFRKGKVKYIYTEPLVVLALWSHKSAVLPGA